VIFPPLFENLKSEGKLGDQNKVTFNSFLNFHTMIINFSASVTIFSLLSLFLLTSCNKEKAANSFLKKESVTPRSTPLEFAATTGNLHNEGLERLRLTFDFSESYPNNYVKTDSIFYNLSAFYYEEAGFDPAISYQSYMRDSFVSMLNGNKLADANISAYWQSWRNNAVTSYLTTAELQFIDSMFVFFSQNFSGLTRQQVSTLAYNKAVSLLSQFNQLSWSIGHGTLACGSLNVMKSSSSYWYSHSPGTFIGSNMDPNNEPTGQIWGFIVQADCLGYIGGWVSALIDDVHGGGVTPSGQNRRIQQGFNGAAVASGGRALGWW